MFGHQQQQQQQQQQYRSGTPHRSSQVDSVSCSQYLCPITLDCVPLPVDCPCPDEQDIKCAIPDIEGDVDEATVVCVRGQEECAQVEWLMHRGTPAAGGSWKGKKGSKTRS
ncbi:hypothetical protein BD779DRAFT_1492282 [Infundibulicybe gibba]|nr:hypothetical protein BD779DRAFT_1492282 [Infundibulicybe gibba]